MVAPPQTAILIVGMHRSGTSALAGIVGKLGVPLGDRLLAPGSDNPKGYWEHQDVVALHERLLNRLGSRWDDVRALPDGWLESEAAREAAVAISDIISRDFPGNPVWAVKDPRICRVLPLWLEVLQKHHIRPVVLFMVRKPSEVSASIEARNHWHPLVGKLLWLRYMAEAVTASSTLPREVVLYDDLLVDPISLVTKAFAGLGVEVGAEVSGQQRKVIADFVDASDRHHTSAGAEVSSSKVEAISEELYESLVAVAHGANRWNSVDEIVVGFHREWQRVGACVDAVAGMAARVEQGLRLAEAESFRLNSALLAQIRWSEEAQAKHEVGQAENAELSSKLAAQIRWSGEAQAKHEVLQAENAELSSKLAAQIRWSGEAQAKHEMLQAENAELSSKLTAQIRWSGEAQAKHEVLQAENAELSSKLTAQIRWSDEAQAKLEALQAESARQAVGLREATGERDRIAGELAQTLESRLALAAELENLYASASWKLTKPLRSVTRLFGNKTGPTNSPTRKPQ